MSPCPPPEALRRLGGDSLDAEAFRAIERHVEGCAGCRERLEEEAARLDPPGATARRPPTTRLRPPEIPGFRIGGELGRGGCGVVYEAVQLSVGRRVALKVVAGGPTLDARSRDLWLREARAIGRVRHPNVVRLHEAGEHDGWLYLVLDLVPGGSLADRADGPLPPRVAAGLVEPVARAVGAIHAAGLLHLDVKPSNILLDGPPGARLDLDLDLGAATPLLSDFGIARDEADLGATAAAATGALGARGTPAYMAPEQVAGPRGAIGPRADVFALGATLYALLTGRPPFQAASPMETLDLLRAREPARPRDLVPHLPRDLETICLTCLRKDPARRYASAGALADDLRRWLGGYPIHARPTSRAEHALRRCRRHPAPAALGVTLVVGLVVLTALWRRSEAQRARADVALARAREGEAAAEGAVARLAALIGTGLDGPERQFGGLVDEVYPVVLGLTAQLRGTPRLAAAHAAAVAGLELRLVDHLRARGGYDRAAPLVEDALALLRVAGPARPRDAAAAVATADCLLKRAEVTTASRPGAACRDCRGAEQALEPHALDPRATSTLVVLQEMRRCVALAQAEGGDPEAARRTLGENVALFGRLARARPGDPTLALLDALSRHDREPAARGAVLALVAEAIRRLPAGARLPRALLVHLGDRIARDLFEAHAAAGASPRPDPGAVAAAILGALDAWAAGLPIEPELRYAIAHQLSQYGAVQSIHARQAGRLDESRWAIDWMSALGRALVGRPLDAGGAHILLSWASHEEHKLAWRIDPDRATLERTLRAALAEGTMALALNPDHGWTRRHVASLRERYVRFIAPKPAAGAAP